MRLIRTCLVLVLAGALLCLFAETALAQGGKKPDKGQGPAPAAQDGPKLPGGAPPPDADPNFVFGYIVAFLLVAGVLLVVCMPSRKSQ